MKFQGCGFIIWSVKKVGKQIQLLLDAFFLREKSVFLFVYVTMIFAKPKL